MPHVLNDAEVKAFHKDGFVIVKNFFNKEEIDKLYGIATGDSVVKQNAVDLNDQTGRKTKLTLWFTPGNDVYSMLLRSERMVHSVAKLLDSDAPVCHFHTKLMQKEPKVGGAWEWHQDYGYWYKNQFLFPDQLVSVMIALTEANKANGCLQVIKGTHKLGRVNHGFAGEQVGADMTMVNNALQTMEHVYVELEPGDALFFHSNILHRSEANLSDRPRWSLISCYNSLSNPAYNDESTSWREPVQVVPDSALMDSAIGGAANDGDFLKKEKDPALKETGWEKEVATT
ncbi:phytanoyl-CoA dioxygenase family protein [Panacibacter sp. DH6]|uniref:Phytanoyl-CoA dioxygenase family protein n=1 Tax=Panacibacter microcysteis TaxID=2793269 RepID=A0A931MF34_9BACT|nr:phytanoyl-CoA dioxygenase family protein [Panacibacter microcysteis]MBG9378654.1 phytanoyl-CoA dioxygenase family protein [Panacibacter microcysteis]